MENRNDDLFAQATALALRRAATPVVYIRLAH